MLALELSHNWLLRYKNNKLCTYKNISNHWAVPLPLQPTRGHWLRMAALRLYYSGLYPYLFSLVSQKPQEITYEEHCKFLRSLPSELTVSRMISKFSFWIQAMIISTLPKSSCWSAWNHETLLFRHSQCSCLVCTTVSLIAFTSPTNYTKWANTAEFVLTKSNRWGEMMFCSWSYQSFDEANSRKKCYTSLNCGKKRKKDVAHYSKKTIWG